MNVKFVFLNKKKSIIIKEKDIKKLSIRVMKKFYDNIYNNNFLEKIDNVKLMRKYYDENIIKNFIDFYKNRKNMDITLEKFNNKRRYGNRKSFLNLLKLFDIKNIEDLEDLKNYEDLVKKEIENEVINGKLNYLFINNFLNKMIDDLKININYFLYVNSNNYKIDPEYKNYSLLRTIKAYINIVEIYYTSYLYLVGVY